jgi:DNA-3-methyladenine glycosylase II
MGLTTAQLQAGLDAVAATDPAIATALARAGYPDERINKRGMVTLLRTIVGQQVSYKAAASIWNKCAGIVGDVEDPRAWLTRSEEELRAGGLSRQKISYMHSLAHATASGALDFDAMPVDDEEAIAALVAVKGIGRWSAEVYLLFSEGRTDIWPAGDLAVQIETGRILGLDAKPSERQTRQLAEKWAPHRGALAIFMWHHYKTAVI